MDGIVRLGCEDPRCSRIVTFGGVTYLTGQTSDKGSRIKQQTEIVLNKIDKLLAEAGTDKSQLLTAMIWLRNVQKDFVGMNEVWNKWIDGNNKPVRACVQSTLAREGLLVEIQVTAANPNALTTKSSL
mmetsp:Transcript_41269/g.84422  ORF Transcript_41269/g.84422 Transcript_41269/m.84422 type:complete len:128 (+) Transcript_41269:101-484(+)